jgi:hypothetical protein
MATGSQRLSNPNVNPGITNAQYGMAIRLTIPWPIARPSGSVDCSMRMAKAITKIVSAEASAMTLVRSGDQVRPLTRVIPTSHVLAVLKEVLALTLPGNRDAPS